MGAVIDAYQAACARITLAFDGFLADFRGDGILAYFGYPRAHEDDAERTVRAALDIAAAVARLKTPAEEPLSVRIGIATGLVVVGDRGGEARCGSILWLATRRALRRAFRPWRSPGRSSSPRPHAGCSAICSVCAILAFTRLRVLPSRSRRGRLRACRLPRAASRRSTRRVLTELIGREDELDFLLERQRLAWKGEGQVVLISGEPGIGKSRLVAALEERIADQPHTFLQYQCSPHHTNSALYPFIAQLERAVGFKADDTSEERLDKLEALLAIPAPRVQEIAPLFAALLSIPIGDRYPKLPPNPAQQRRRTFAALLDQFEESRTSEADPPVVRGCRTGPMPPPSSYSI